MFRVARWCLWQGRRWKLREMRTGKRACATARAPSACGAVKVKQGRGGAVRDGATWNGAAALAWLVVAMTVLPIVVAPARGQDRTQGRSMVVTREGIVAAESPLAAQAGATILARGGNAVDAAVATNAVMGVVE